MQFEWDEKKNLENIKKHDISFEDAVHAFDDPDMFVLEDKKHSQHEKRMFCFGIVNGEVLTVRFTYRGNKIRIFGAGYWREGSKEYDKKNKMG